MSASVRFNPPTEDDLREFIDLSLNFLCIAGTDGYFKYVNPAWETTFGYTREELPRAPILSSCIPRTAGPRPLKPRALHLAAVLFLLRIATVVMTDPTNGYYGLPLFTRKED